MWTHPQGVESPAGGGGDLISDLEAMKLKVCDNIEITDILIPMVLHIICTFFILFFILKR
jgi:hypothetical protein